MFHNLIKRVYYRMAIFLNLYAQFVALSLAKDKPVYTPRFSDLPTLLPLLDSGECQLHSNWFIVSDFPALFPDNLPDYYSTAVSRPYLQHFQGPLQAAYRKHPPKIWHT